MAQSQLPRSGREGGPIKAPCSAAPRGEGAQRASQPSSAPQAARVGQVGVSRGQVFMVKQAPDLSGAPDSGQCLPGSAWKVTRDGLNLILTPTLT